MLNVIKCFMSEVENNQILKNPCISKWKHILTPQLHCNYFICALRKLYIYIMSCLHTALLV